MEITQADERHITAIQQIYAWHVLHGTATFETEPPDVAEMTARQKKIHAAGLPWFVATENGDVRKRRLSTVWSRIQDPVT